MYSCVFHACLGRGWQRSLSQLMESNISIILIIIYIEPVSSLWNFHAKLRVQLIGHSKRHPKTFEIQSTDRFQLGCFWCLLHLQLITALLCRPVHFSWWGSSGSWSQLLIMGCQRTVAPVWKRASWLSATQRGSRGSVAMFTWGCVLRLLAWVSTFMGVSALHPSCILVLPHVYLYKDALWPR